MPETRKLTETYTQDGLTHDPAEPVLRNVLLVGLESKNGRKYKPEALQEAVASGRYRAFVNVNHPEGRPTRPRQLEERFGAVENERFVPGEGVRGDIRYNPEHRLSKFVRWFAENMPRAIGASHNVDGAGHTDKGTFVVESVARVRSVDLVADPATTKGLMEAMMDEYPALGSAGEAGYEEQVGKLVSAIVCDESLSADEKRKKILTALKLMDEAPKEEPKKEETAEKKEEKPADKIEEAVKALAGSDDPHVKALVESVDAYRVKAALDARRSEAAKLCEAAKLPKTALTEIFLEQLSAAKDAAEMKRLIEDRRAIVGASRPRSVSAADAGRFGQMSAKEFAARLKVKA